MEGVYSDGTDTGQQVCRSLRHFLSSLTPLLSLPCEADLQNVIWAMNWPGQSLQFRTVLPMGLPTSSSGLPCRSHSAYSVDFLS